MGLVFVIAIKGLLAQEPHEKRFGLSTAVFKNDVYRQVQLDGAGGVDAGSAFALGIQFNYHLKGKFWLGTAFEYFEANNTYKGAVVNPQVSLFTKEIQSRIVSLPVFLKYYPHKLIYLKPGITFDYQFNNTDGAYIDNQSGVGISFSAGFEIKVLKMVYLAIEPGFGLTSIINLHGGNFPQRFFCYGLGFNAQIGL
ncbi:MAG: hypothetical protein K9G58_13775 [Bacteroidales bacterium]|nr:hypothetical protein [Bacteroidales bacterium]MCF8388392.1 hypothetical protein [Bacteroidales bacterium]MCF8399239.1 hypothetical protein [Bacteroidales bacterium]